MWPSPPSPTASSSTSSTRRTKEDGSQSLGDLRPRLITDIGPEEPWFAANPARARRLLDLGVHSLLVTPLDVHDTALGLAIF